ncbi:hypothetical protein FJV41_23930 [Myxococcus llanfairpwllgwyngyllgogerychwyrndrobwllllantysiliogogogochensis]|uniref:Uncharacterized protein n=1 Tax=Myxococcus llanfairpwllgwyngyllgogerychwyrndrobwllllantysiliogogogochensis TaxID=2590453 RepID=A0A540WWR9_9BACT|nr:hypothetical protein [Myxococcus llanfairpwllgwyngyllgogerychwyrndrobwllllantysiliogogogochensis]TQF13442.1 hypothetical protein FJV41_23930 [Myxococcus llanfairpwllgwyngyllgogerychwyrndrobwllllantysiliogogogochensis]
MKIDWTMAYTTLQVSGHRAEIIVARDELRRAELDVRLAPVSAAAQRRLEEAREKVAQLASRMDHPTPSARC